MALTTWGDILRRIARTTLTCAILIAVGWLALVILTIPHGTGDKAKSAEAKANLHNIQLSLEHYAVDHGGVYPAYLIGGEAKYAATVKAKGGVNMFQGITDCDLAQVSDPLLREGYLDAYPRNPFVREGQAIHKVQERLVTSLTGNDPLRNGAPEGAALGTRFGPYCNTMGQVLCDPRYPQWNYTDPTTGATTPRDSWAIVEYQFWDMTPEQRKKDPILAISPGQFFYKSMGPLVLPESAWTNGVIEEEPPYVPPRSEYYILGVYGGIKNKGEDYLGEEQQVEISIRRANGQQDIGCIWPWTRSQLRPPARMGSPYRKMDGGFDCWPGNANGILDGIILMLDGGQLPADG